MKIDLHIHTEERSPCAHASEHAQIQAAISAGLDAIAITDHDLLVAPAHLAELNRRYTPFQVLCGVEITLSNEEHIIVVGLQEKALESRRWTYPALWEFIRAHAGYMALAHPFRFHNSIEVPIDQYPPDAIEVYSTNTSSKREAQIRTIAHRLGIGLLSDSDAHIPDPIGCYFNDLPGQYTGEAEILRQLKNNHLQPQKSFAGPVTIFNPA